ncbi:CsbD family protein [Streptomyces sp. NPDC102441]|uniref:CsbD family protein n=1 Tax=Streptomyces sp. NPDC102441 TaxID=3366176 RepID=UPI0037F635BF
MFPELTSQGKVKEPADRAVGNGHLTAEGRACQTKGEARRANKKAKDAYKR